MRLSDKDLSKFLTPAQMKKIGIEPKTATNKYKNVKVYIYKDKTTYEKLKHETPLMVFDSKKEHQRYLELKLLQKAGEISHLDRQKVFVIQDEYFNSSNEKIKKIQYKADFFYFDKKIDRFIVEDVKPFDERTGKFRTTKDFNLKWKLLQNKYPEFNFIMY